MGNGGFAGTIHRPTLAEAAARGDAAAATDTGHRGDGFDARWAAGRPDLVADYAYRSIKVTADAARAIAERYYGKPPQRRYFMGCSNGGRQALVAAARWPSDWDGVLAGAPAARWSNTLANFAVIQHQLRAVPGGWIAPQRLPALIAHARSTCPAGETCRFDPSGQGLSPLQVASLQTVEAAGYPLAAADAAEWARWIVNPDPVAPSQLTFATQAMRHLFAVDRAWTPARHDPRRDRASPPLAGALDVGDLTPFLARGGRILSYFGWADAVLPPAIAVADYRGRAARDSRLRDGYRLFMVPGMAHCQGGAVPHAFGQSLPARALLDDADHDVRRALETWVERGTAPDRLIAADPAGRQAPVALRPL